MGAASLKLIGSQGMETELLGSSSGNLAGKGSQNLGPFRGEMWRSRKGKFFKEKGERGGVQGCPAFWCLGDTLEEEDLSWAIH